MESEVILFLLLTGNGPLFKLFLVPVEFKLDLFHLFVDSENSDLDVIESFLMFQYVFVVLFDFALESAGLPFGDLPEMVLSLSLIQI